MSPLLQWLTSPEWALVVKTLLHSLWQGALIAAGLALVFRRVANPSARYRIALVALGALFAISLVTWGVLNAPQTSLPVASPAAESVAPTPIVTGPVEKIVVAANWTPAKSPTQWTAWLALAWLLGASAMLGRASVKVAGAEQLRRSCQPLNDPRITELVAEARRSVKLTRQVRVAVTNQLTSPAVVGVLVPTLILPLSLITTLSPEQLRFILLHELAHIRRGDYLANLFQLFAEALFFFNPAVWWLSHQIRREREACCDALAIELSGAPADYARTLVSVAETMLHPSPAAAPAFGNDHEPSSLSDRVHRVLVPGYRPSLRLTWRAMLGGLASSIMFLWILAVGTKQTVAATTSLLSQTERPPAATQSGSIVGLTDSTPLPPVSLSNSSPTIKASAAVVGRGQITNELENIRLAQVSFDMLPLSEVVRLLCDESRKRNPEKRGINFIISPAMPSGAQIDPTTGLPKTPAARPGINLAALPITIQPALHDVNLREALEAIIKASPQPITYAVEDYGIMIKVAETNVVPLFTRTFKVDTNEFARALGMVGPVAATNFHAAHRDFFSSLGVDLEAPGKSLFYGDRRGTLFVRATLADLDIIEQALSVMNAPVPQVNIQAKFIEVTQNDTKAIGFDWYLGNVLSGGVSQGAQRGSALGNPGLTSTNLVSHLQAGGKFSLTSNLLTGILTPAQASVVFRALEQRQGVEILSSPSVVTLSGRQAQIQIMDMKTIVTGTKPVVTNGVTTNVLQTAEMPFGPTLDVIPYVSADGYTVQMTLIPSMTEFLGYGKPDAALTNYAGAKPLSAAVPLPHYRLRQAVAQANVWDGQTIVIGGLTTEIVTRHPDGSITKMPDPAPLKKQLFVFITPTIIDPAGNRVHTDEEMPFRTNSVPRQSGK